MMYFNTIDSLTPHIKCNTQLNPLHLFVDYYLGWTHFTFAIVFVFDEYSYSVVTTQLRCMRQMKLICDVAV